jgi:hypothetical protein
MNQFTHVLRRVFSCDKKLGHATKDYRYETETTLLHEQKLARLGTGKHPQPYSPRPHPSYFRLTPPPPRLDESGVRARSVRSPDVEGSAA